MKTLVLLVTATGLAATAASGEADGTLVVHVMNSLGQAVDNAQIVISSPEGLPESIRVRARPGEAISNVIYHSNGYPYELDVSAGGYRTYRRRISLDERTSEVFCVLQARLIEGIPRGATLSGEVRGELSPFILIWASLIPTGRAQDTVDRKVDAGGAFRFQSLTLGTYLLSILAAPRNGHIFAPVVLDCQTVEIKEMGSQLELEIDLSRQAARARTHRGAATSAAGG